MKLDLNLIPRQLYRYLTQVESRQGEDDCSDKTYRVDPAASGKLHEDRITTMLNPVSQWMNPRVCYLTVTTLNIYFDSAMKRIYSSVSNTTEVPDRPT